MIVYFNGEYLDKSHVRISPDDRGFLFGDGIYEVLRSYGKHFFEAAAHLDRMAHGLEELEISGWESTNFASVGAELLDRNRLNAQAIVYIQVTRGAPTTRTHAFPTGDVPPTVYVTAFSITPKADPTVGVSVITTPDVRWGRCDLKTTNILANCLTQQRAHENGAFESILIRDGVALESSASSFFAVVDGQVRTAPKSNHILPSITREVVLRLCAEAGISHRETPVPENQLAQATEMFLAGTTLEVLPIVRVDGNPVGDGVPGPITTRIRQLFAAEVARQTGVGTK
ncbi:MAG: aminotransferase class IV [Gemmatimonadales bacterium]